MADRELVEGGSDIILEGAQEDDIAFLVVGDALGATTHTDLILRARELNIKYEVIHNASVMNAIGACGLQLYNFGQTVSLVFFTDTWKPESFYEKVLENRRIGLHTLLLLDIKVKEQSIENMARGRLIYEPPRYMSVATAAQQLLEIEEKRQEGAYGPNTPCVGVSRLGSPTQAFCADTLEKLADYDAGEPLHSLIMLGNKVHDLETDFIAAFAPNEERLRASIKEDANNFKKPEPVIPTDDSDDE